MDGNNILVIVSGIIAAINGAVLVLAAWKKLKPEVKRMEQDIETDNIETANLNLEGAKVSGLILLDRINELKGELQAERELRKSQVANMKQEYKELAENMERARKEDVEYFRRRIKDLEKESRDYRQWAARLVKQVVEAGKAPVPFIPSISDSETGITAIRTELETGPLTPPERDKK